MTRKAREFTNQKKGIPQGNPLSPVLMNIFLHQLDVRITAFMNQEKNVRYVRYADDMLFGIKRNVDLEKRNRRLRQFFNKALDELQLKATSVKLIRGKSKPREMLVLGLLVSIKQNGNLVMRAPLLRWKKKLTFSYIMGKIGEKDFEEFLGGLVRESENLCGLHIRMFFVSGGARNESILQEHYPFQRQRVHQSL